MRIPICWMLSFLVSGSVLLPAARGQEELWDELNLEAAELYEAGKYDDALRAAQSALAVVESSLGKTHPRVAVSLNNIALIHYAQGRFAESEKACRRSLLVRLRSPDPNGVDVDAALTRFCLVRDRITREAAGTGAVADGKADPFLLAGTHEMAAARMAKQLAESRSEIARLRASLNAAVAALNAGKEETVAAKRDAAQREKELLGRVQAAERECAEAVAAVVEVREAGAANNETLRSELAKRELAVDAAANTVDVLRDELKTQQELGARAADALKGLRDQLAAQREEQRQVENKLAQSAANLTEARSQADETKRKLTEANKAAAAKEQTMAYAVVTAQGETVGVREQLAGRRAELREVSGQWQLTRKRLSAREKELADMAISVRKSEADLAAELKQCAKLESNLTEATKELMSARSSIGHVNADLSSLKDLSARRIHVLESELTAARREEAATSKELLKLQNQLAGVHQRLVSAAARETGETVDGTTDEHVAGAPSVEISGTEGTGHEELRRALESARSALSNETSKVAMLSGELRSARAALKGHRLHDSRGGAEVTQLRTALAREQEKREAVSAAAKFREKRLQNEVDGLSEALKRRATSRRLPEGVSTDGNDAAAHPIRVWRYRNGGSVRARFIRRSSAQIFVLEDADGSRVAVSLSALSAEDQDYARSIGKE